MATDHELVQWKAAAKVLKWEYEADWVAGQDPDEVVEDEGNLLTTAGITRLLNLLIGAGGQAYTNGYARLGTGNGTTAPATTDTDMSGTSKLYHGMDATFPSVSGNVVTFQATYQAGEGNYIWAEWALDAGGGGSGTTNATVVAPLLNHRVPATNLGTKTGGIWQFQVTITLS